MKQPNCISFSKLIKVIAIALMIGLASAVYGQKQKVENLPKHDVERLIKFGFTLAVNTTNFRVRMNPDKTQYSDLLSLESQSHTGFLLGILSNMRINDWYDVRFMPAISFCERTLEYRFQDITGIKNVNRRIESTFLEFPVLLKYKSNRLNNTRMYMLGGAKYTLDLASQIKVSNLNFPDSDKIVKLRKDDLCWEVGVGIDFYLQYFKFSIEVKKSYGFRDMLVQDSTIYSTPIQRLKSQMMIVSFHFQ